ncbi:MAG: hypothetical protein AAF467_22325 [Actinomycetota bacterium]
MLLFQDPSGAFVDHTQATGNGLVGMEFTPRVRLNPPAPGSPPNAPLQSFDLTVESDGVITADPATSSTKVSSFWLDITCTITSGSGTVTDERSIHVVVHDLPATTAWTTPDPITLRSPHQGTRSYRRPNVYVQFPDGAIADVTPLPGTTYVPDNPLLPNLESAANGQQLTTSTISGWDPLLWSPPWFGSFTASVPSYIAPGLTATGGVRVEYPWEVLSPADRTVTCLDASSMRAADADAAAANVLILGDGFTSAQRLEDFARGLAVYTKRLPTFRMLGDRFRFWVLPLVGHTGGVSVRTLATDTIGGAHAPPQEPTDTRPPWIDTDLLHLIGYPSTEVANGPAPTLSQAAVDWSQLYDVAATDIDSGDPANPALQQSDINAWLANSQRVPLNEADTLYGVVRGTRTSVEDDRSFSLRQIRRDELDRLLGNLVDADGTAMGSRWTAGGIDGRLIFMLLEGHTEAAVFSPGNGMVLAGAQQETSAQRRNASVASPSGNGLDAVPVSSGPFTSVSAAMIRRPGLRSTFTHEFAHALGLGDEYGGSHDLPADRAAEVAGDPNLALHSDVFGAGFDPDAIGWARWHRIRHALRLDPGDPVATLPTSGHPSGEAPVDGSGHVAYEIRFQPGEIMGARVGSRVPELAAAGSTTPTEPVIFVRERNADVLGPADAIGPLTLLWVDEAGDRVVVRETAPGMVPTSVLNLSTDRRSAPIAFVPVPKPAEADGFARLLPKTVRDHLATTRRPLDAYPVSTHPISTWTRFDTPSSGSDWPKMLNKPTTGSKKLFYARRVPALWTGGLTFNYGVHHPTSHSVMRGSSSRTYKGPATSLPPGETGLPSGDVGALPGVGDPNHHGPVGEYLLVDRYAPELHHLVEARLARADPD